jgi:hypothetical protein
MRVTVSDLISRPNRWESIEKEQCAKVYKIYTGEEIEAFRWNRKAADLLAEMVKEIEVCSRKLGTVLACFPKSLPGNGEWLWLAEIVLDIIKNEALIHKGYLHTTCIQQITERRGFVRDINFAIMK